MRRKSILSGLILILVGLWFLASNLGFRWPGFLDWGQLWPAFIILGGLISLWSYFSSQNQDPDQIFLGVAAIGVGCFFFLFTLELRLPVFGRFEWNRMAEWWPGFVLIGGLAFLARFILTGFRDVQALVLGILALIGAVIAFAFSLGFLSRTFARRLLDFWPLILVILGLGMLGRPLLRRR